MEKIRFYYKFKDETESISDTIVDMTCSRDSGVSLEEVVETFVKFLEAVGFSPKKAMEYFPEEMSWD